MPKLVARLITLSLDGFSAAKGQALDAPFGKDGLRLMAWAFATQYFAKMTGKEAVPRASTTISSSIPTTTSAPPSWAATCSARARPWPNEDWKGWWGPEPTLSPPGLRAQPSQALELRDGRRHQLQFHQRWHRVASKAAFYCGKGQRRSHRRGRFHGPASI